MSEIQEYSIVHQPQALLLYRVYRGKVFHVLQTKNFEEILSFLQDQKISRIKFFCQLPFQTIKTEKSFSDFNHTEYLQWSRQKRKDLIEKFSFLFFKIFWKSQEIFFVGLPEESSSVGLLRQLKSAGLFYEAYSYTVELGTILNRLLVKLKPLVRNFLIITVSRSLIVTIWFFEDNKLLSWRMWTLFPQDALVDRIKFFVHDTLRYLEKVRRDMSAVTFTFFLDSDISEQDLALAFDKSIIFSNEQLKEILGMEENQEDIFNSMVLSQKSLSAMLFSKSERMRSITYFFKASFVFKIANALCFVACSYLFFICMGKYRENQKIIHDNNIIKNQIFLLDSRIKRMGITNQQAIVIREVNRKSLLQQEKFWNFMGRLPQILGKDYRVVSMILADKKTKLMVKQSSQKKKELSFYTDFLDSWCQVMPKHLPTKVQNPDDKASSVSTLGRVSKKPMKFLLLECPSIIESAP